MSDLMIALDALEYWHWLAMAVLCIVIEVFAPGVIFLWFGVGAAVVGLGLLLTPMPGEVQLLLFGVVSLSSLVLGRRYWRRHPTVSEREDLNIGGSGMVGRVLVVSDAIEAGVGSVRVGDSTWRAVADEDIAVGTRVQVVAAEGASLRVVPHSAA